MNFEFAYGQSRFVAIDAAPAAAAKGTEGPGDEALSFLARSLEAACEPNRVVLMHCPPHFDVMQAFDPIDGRARIAFGG